MGGQAKRPKPLTFQELTELRRKTEVVSKFMLGQLAVPLAPLRPIVSPERLFGKFLGAKGDATSADRAFAQLQQSYKPFSTKPFDIPSEFDEHWLTLVGNRVALYPWEYSYEAKTDRETKTISIASPVRWVVSFTSGYTLSQVRQGVAGKGERRVEPIRQFVVNALVAQAMVTHAAGPPAAPPPLGHQDAPHFPA